MVTKFFRLIFLMVLALCDDGVVKSNDFCHKNLSPQMTYNWKKCRGSFTISHLNKLKENVKPPSKIYENPLEHSNPYLNNTDWCLGPYLQFLVHIANGSIIVLRIILYDFVCYMKTIKFRKVLCTITIFNK